MNQVLDSLVNDPTVGAIGLALAGTAVGLWLAAAWWTYTDMARRSSSELARLTAVGWILLSSPALLLLSLPTYLLARPQATVAERRAQRLFQAIEPSMTEGRCPTCASTVDADWRRCPACAAWLASACADCGEWSALDLESCPWCAGDKARGVATVDAERPAAIAASASLGTAAGAEPAISRSGRRMGVPARPVAAPAGRRPNLAGQRGARDLRRTYGAERAAGSGRMRVGS
ncbi:MAG TPA: hypothetical protein VIU37_07875 [Candidatus Limnocylindrales bacterium]